MLPHVGFGSADITPAPGAELPGGFERLVATGTRDPLLATACVVHDGTATLALVGLDAIFAPADVVAEARGLIEKATRIPGANVLVAASHTHSGGPLAGGFGSTLDPAYGRAAARGVADAVTAAWGALHAAEAGVGTGKAEGVAFNRRFLVRGGREITHPGKPGTKHHGEIVGVAGPADPDLGVLAFRRPGGGPLAGLVVHFACHSTVVGGDRFSPDYAGDLRRHLRAAHGDDMLPVVFLNGACGDVTQVDNHARESEFGPAHADRMGRTLAAEAARVAARLAWLRALPLAAATVPVALAVRPEPDADRERPAYGLGSGRDALFAAERRAVAAMRAQAPVVTAHVQGLRLGPLGLAANGAEFFCELGQRVKRCSTHATTWVVTMANENVGYVPTAAACHAGGYEPRTARSSFLAPDAGQLLVEASLAALGRVAPQQG